MVPLERSPSSFSVSLPHRRFFGTVFMLNETTWNYSWSVCHRVYHVSCELDDNEHFQLSEFILESEPKMLEVPHNWYQGSHRVRLWFIKNPIL
jgi:hypothetical protein